MSFNGSGSFLINTAGQPVVSGTVISSTAFNALTADLATGLSTCITKDGQTTVTANIPMANYKFTGLGAGSGAADSANLSQVQSTVVKLLASVSGTDTITAVGSPTVAAYAAGQMFYFVAAGDNTGAVTINIDSLGAKAVTRDGSVALVAGDIKSGEVVVIVYDGTRFQVVSQLNSSGDARFANVSIASALNVGGVATVTGGSVLNGGVVINEPGADVDFRVEGDTDANLIFADASTDRLGIGTSSPQDKLSVLTAQGLNTAANPVMTYGASTNWAAGFANIYDASYVDQFMLLNARMTGGTRAAPTFNANSPANGGIALKVDGLDGGLAIQTIPNGTGQSATTRLYLNPSGNLGLGVTPSAWGSSWRVSQVGPTGGAAFNFTSNRTFGFTNNGYNDNTNWRYVSTGFSTLYVLGNDGSHAWSYAASGTAGNTITFRQAMTLSNNADRATLDINGNTQALLSFSHASTRKSYIYQVDSDLIKMNEANGYMSFGTNNTERARITSGGQLLVGTTTTVVSGSEIAGFQGGVGLGVKSTGGTSSFAGAFWNDATTGDNVIIRLYTDTAGTERGSITYNRGAGQVAYNVTSDVRLKDNIANAADCGDKIDAIKVRKFDWKETGNHVDYGFVAQELEAVAPHAVSKPEDEEAMWSVDYSKLVPMLIKELQSLRKRVAELEAK